MPATATLQTVRTNLFLFIWVFLTIFFVGCMFLAYLMAWTDERLVILLSGAIGSSINAIAMLTNTTLKGGNRLSDIGGGEATVESTVRTTQTTETVSGQTSEPEKTKEKP